MPDTTMHSYRHYNASFNTSEASFVWYGGLCGLRDVTGIQVYTTFLILLAVISTIENLAVLIVFSKNKALRTPSLLLFAILAGIDFVTGCIVTPIKASITKHPNLLENWQTVMVFMVLFMAVVLLSLSTVMLISFDRFCHVYFLNNYNFTKRRMCLALFCAWVVPVLFIVCLLSGLDIGKGDGMFVLVYFFACILATIVAYTATVIVLRKHATNPYYEMNQEVIQSEHKAVRTVLIILVTCILMNILPIVSIAFMFMGKHYGGFCAITFFVMLLNSAVNPLIYCLRIPIMKENVFKLLNLKDGSSRANIDEFRDITITEQNTPDDVIEGGNKGSPETEAEIPYEGQKEKSLDVPVKKNVTFE